MKSLMRQKKIQAYFRKTSPQKQSMLEDNETCYQVLKKGREKKIMSFKHQFKI